MKFMLIVLSMIWLGILLFGCGQKIQKTNTKFSIDDDGMLVLNGKRIFIIGTYHLPKGNEPYAQLSDAGYNYVHVNASQEALDAAQKNGLLAWITTGNLKDSTDSEGAKRIIELVRKFKTHPALLCWEMQDEPAFTWNSAELRVKPEPLIQTYNLIKKEDPEHFVYTNHAPVNLISTLKKYNPSTDIVAVDIYPVIPYGIRITYALYPDGLQGDLLNTYISQVGEYTNKMKAVVEYGKPVFLVLQGFAWEMLRKEGDRDSSMIKYPSYEESRFMAYNAIIHGANGVNYWGTAYTPQPSEFWDDLKKVTRELSDLQEVLSTHSIEMNIAKEYHELRYSVDTGVEILVKKLKGKTYLLTANTDKNPVKVTLSGLNIFNNAQVLYENRSLVVQNGKLTDLYKPFDVHIYEF